MKIERVKELVPEPNATNVALNAPILIRFEDSVKKLNTEKCVSLKHLTTVQKLQQVRHQIRIFHNQNSGLLWM